MDKLKMQTANKADENYKKLAEMFPNAVTETIDENGEVVRAIDKDVLMQEINTKVVDGSEERYQFTWPDKKKSVLLANAPINKTLRPCREESVDFDNTENLYIEGDNLEVLKLLQETYLGKIKMIYIDPPYNTGNDFVYEDDFAQSTEEYLANSGQFDDEGNRLVKNLNSNGRFHTDWLNMMYPRLTLTRDLLSDDGVIIVSMDDNEQSNLIKQCIEVFGANSYIGEIPVLSNPRGRQSSEFIAQTHEYITIFAKNRSKCCIYGEDLTDEQKKEYKYSDENGAYRLLGLRLRGGRCTASESPTLHFPIYYDIENNDFYLERKKESDYEIIPKFEDGTLGTWRWSKQKIEKDKNLIQIKKVKDRYDAFTVDYLLPDKRMKLKSLWYEKEINYDNSSRELNYLNMGEIFDYAKPIYLMKKIIKTMSQNNSIILDFFSGSATTAHAVMQLNAEDGGHRKFIMVQLPEKTDEKSEAYKAGYQNICEIGKERIRRAGKQIMQSVTSGAGNLKGQGWGCGMPSTQSEWDYAIKNILDIGFRVLKCDSSNMKDVYYNPADYEQSLFSTLEDNIKEDRTPEDLLFQVMLDLGILLSSKIEETVIDGKKVFNVADGFLIACFDENVTDETITAIAKQKPYYFVMRDSSMASDSVATNFEQIFATYSPDTVRKVL